MVHLGEGRGEHAELEQVEGGELRPRRCGQSRVETRAAAVACMCARPREVGQVTRGPTTELRLRGFGRGAKELRGDRRRQADVRGAVRNVCERLCAARAQVGGRGGD